MSRTGATLTALALAGAAFAASPRFEMRSFVNVEGRVGAVQPAFAWCDAPDRVLAVTQPAHDPRTTAQPVTLHRWLKRPQMESDAGKLTAPFLLGPSEGAAGSIYTRLSFPDGSGTNANFFIRTSNVENVLDPAYRLSRVNEFRTPEGSFPCRYQPQAVFMGATAKRTVIVWDNGRTATYATRNFDGTPGVYVTGGKVSADDIGPEYTFRNGSYTYLVKFHPYAAFVRVQRGGRTLRTETFLAYSYSQPVQEQP
ncbi:hypothetical protein [Deinococcus sp. NW-56]|uniref:hypothetical protein n=1 Tax=Deinococcus sp. NW-56 TaxID=2080419 RepID=UPI00131A1D66|nr:hypothetical protein [Deinococcus sp. NW-56]